MRFDGQGVPMKEAQWLSSLDAPPMLRFLGKKLSDRKFRLFACGGCRRVWKSLSLKPVREVVEAAERFADGEMDTKTLWTVWEKSVQAVARSSQRNPRRLGWDARYTVKMFKLALATNVGFTDRRAFFELDVPEPDEVTFRTMVNADLLRCVVGNPFRPVAFDPRWRTEDVLGLGRGIYEDRAFDRLPLLADALMDAGCDSDDILSHCRGEGPHVRGCWVVDLVLGKE
jgi:hypothetical protein